ncbi:MAG TPA: radical SAM protein [Dongiaceae bacterium]|nr:radical SAM protein [Dongiaceae bacterium]
MATFWNYTVACELVGARYPTPPLGLITLAALLPASWEVRLVNRNTEELTAADLAWADIVMTGGMLAQQVDTLELIKLSQAHGKPVAVGGPDPTSSPHVYAAADFQVLGEVEGAIEDFIAAWDGGARSGHFAAPKFTIDVTKSPIPRFDLLKFDHYLYVGVQYSRGCPFTCEFCDIIELYGRVPRAKTTPQMLAELEALYQLGYRGHVDFVDDNLIGNKKALKAFLPELAAWQRSHDYPFEFSTEASINLADDDELLKLMGRANFFTVFVGIESPDPATLVHTRKKQNTKRSLVDSVHKIYRAGMFVTAGFIVGFDSEEVPVADAMADFIADAAIPVCMVGLLYALPNTQLTRRLAAAGRLHPDHDRATRNLGDQCRPETNFDTLRPLTEVLRDYRRILERIYEPSAFAGRLQKLAAMLDRSGRPRELPQGDIRSKVSSLETAHKIIARLPEGREQFWQTFVTCAKLNPAGLRYIVILTAFYLHLGPFARDLIAAIDARLAELDLAAAAARSGRVVHALHG